MLTTVHSSLQKEVLSRLGRRWCRYERAPDCEVGYDGVALASSGVVCTDMEYDGDEEELEAEL